MAKKPGSGSQLIYEAAERFVDECLRKDGSLFTPGTVIWSAHNVEDLHQRFVAHPDTSGDTFEVKFKRQLSDAPVDTVQLAAELVYVHLLISMQLKGDTKRELISHILSWGGLPPSLPADLSSALDDGILNAGQSFLTCSSAHLTPQSWSGSSRTSRTT